MRHAFLLASALLGSGPGTALAQTSRADPTDIQGRVGIEASFDLPDRWKAEFGYRARFVGELGDFRGSYLSSALERGIGKHLTVFGNYRLALVDDGTYHRFGIGFQAETRVGGVRLSLRPQVQYQRQQFDDDDADADGYARVKAAARVSLAKRFNLTASVEPYFKFDAKRTLDNIRNTLEFGYRVSPRYEFKLGYTYRPDFAKSCPRTFHVFEFGTEIGFKLNSKKAKGGKNVNPRE